MSDADELPEDKTPIEQAVEHAFDLLVYAPIGILFEGASLLPELVAKGKGHVATARLMGRFAVDQATKSASEATAKAQDRAAGVVSFLGDSITPLQPEPKAGSKVAATPPTATATARRPPAAAAEVVDGAPAAAASAIDAATLAIPDYDGLSASQVVNRLAGLSAVELDSVQRYEAAHRGRKTILSKVAQLQGR
ncbi:MAG: hypothetical protein ACJ739_05340 [Acidimicrobiales bacterium]